MTTRTWTDYEVAALMNAQVILAERRTSPGWPHLAEVFHLAALRFVVGGTRPPRIRAKPRRWLQALVREVNRFGKSPRLTMIQGGRP